ncbi:PREDICTED: von Willebrand factor A domain-containing protein 5A-like [Cyprinodon variegatus]|uniref:von Willebrand factor A domain-containing protein 5A-like n=1 Tax=Cyprinodon variegatus TaxID=28743 RepID=UPI0007429608|nr:PREDICTED: von Willebrand factor A domain-containing protein 5A-like [Cyprinodon variegatus]
MGDPVVMVSLYPEFPQSVMSSLTSCGEFVFLMDRSGSMALPLDCSNEEKRCINSARDTLMLLLKSLPMGCYFNIYSFGSSFEHIFPTSMEYSEKTMNKALKEVEKMDANLGGTDILQPLQHIYSQPCIPEQPRQLFVFTDGKVGNTKEVIDLVKKNSGSHRCFSFGIGDEASSALINGMAKEGGGHAQFIIRTNRMRPKVMQSLRFALHPNVGDISVSWDLPKGVSATILSPPPAIFQGQRSLIYAQLTGQSSDATEGSVTVKYTLAGHPHQNQLHFDLKPAEDSGLTVHRLASRTAIRSLESEQRTQSGQQDEEVKKKVVELSVQSGVSSSFTAFIAVNKARQFKSAQRPVVLRYIPKDNLKSLPGDFLDKKQPCSVPSPPTVPSPPRTDIQPPRPGKNLLLQLVSLQKASGFWELDADLYAVLGKTKKEVKKSKPKSVNNEVWASILALIWLHGFKMDAKEEWELLTMKTASWIKAQKAPRVSECVEAGNTLLGCNVKKEVLGF